MRKYTILRDHICGVTIQTARNIYAGIPPEELTHRQTVDILSGAAVMRSIYLDDHPEFKELRNRLEVDGCIITRRNCWNCDTVTESFTLNGWMFKQGHRFPSAAAIDVAIDTAERLGKIYSSSP